MCSGSESKSWFMPIKKGQKQNIKETVLLVSALVSIRIHIQSQHFKSLWIWIRYRIWWPLFKKNLKLEKKVHISFQKVAIYFSKNVEAIWQASSPHKEKIQHFQSNTLLHFLLCLWAFFSNWICIRIRLVKIQSDPDPRNINYLGASDS